MTPLLWASWLLALVVAWAIGLRSGHHFAEYRLNFAIDKAMRTHVPGKQSHLVISQWGDRYYVCVGTLDEFKTIAGTQKTESGDYPVDALYAHVTFEDFPAWYGNAMADKARRGME